MEIPPCRTCNAILDKQALSEKDFQIWETPKGKRLVIICPACQKHNLVPLTTLVEMNIPENIVQRVNKIKNPDAINEDEIRAAMVEDAQKKVIKALTAGGFSGAASFTTDLTNRTAEHLAYAQRVGEEIIQRWNRYALIAEQDLVTYVNAAMVFYESYKASGLEKALEEEKKARQAAELLAEFWQRVAGLLAKKASPNLRTIAALDNLFLLALLNGGEVDIEKVKKIIEEVKT